MIRRILVDEDILLDVMLDRKPFAENSVEIWKLIESERIEGYVTPTTLNKIFNVGRENGGIEIAWQAISEIRAIMKVCLVDDKILEQASSYKLQDFETAVQLACAKTIKLDYIITRKLEYSKSFFIQNLPTIFEGVLSVVRPSEFLSGWFYRNRYLDLNRYFAEANNRLNIVQHITNNRFDIITVSTRDLFAEQAQLDEITGKKYTNSQIAACQRDMYIILRYIVYSMLVSNYRILDDSLLNGLSETYQALEISCKSVMVTIQKMKETTIKVVYEYDGFTAVDYRSLISELTSYFDRVIDSIDRDNEIFI